MFKYIIVILFITYINADEKSVFGAGNIESKNPYGLTTTEKSILKNKQRISRVINSIDEIKQRLEGMSSIYEGDSITLNDTQLELKNLKNEIVSISNSLSKAQEISLTNSNNIIRLEKKLDLFISIQKTNNKKILKLLNKIDKSYVTDTKFDELVKFVNYKQTSKKITKTTVTKKTKLTNKQKFKKVKQLMSKNRYTKSIPLLNELIKSKYKPAINNFYMGEVRFIKKQYERAIHYYKTSMILYDEASYIPKLLLHSAISFDKLNDKENARNFYETLIDTYPKTIESKKAKKRLKKL